MNSNRGITHEKSSLRYNSSGCDRWRCSCRRYIRRLRPFWCYILRSAAGANGIAQTFGDDGTGDSSVDITSRFRLQIDATAESDAGVTFGARVRIEQENDEIFGPPAGDGSYNSTGINAPRFFARSGGLEVGVGNIFGALEFMPGMYPIELGFDRYAVNTNTHPTKFGGDWRTTPTVTGAASTNNAVEVMYSAGRPISSPVYSQQTVQTRRVA